MFQQFLQIGYIFHPVVDGDTRHHSKRVYIGKRLLQKEIPQIIVWKTHAQALTLTAILNANVNTLSVTEIQKLELRQSKLEKKLASVEI